MGLAALSSCIMPHCNSEFAHAPAASGTLAPQPGADEVDLLALRPKPSPRRNRRTPDSAGDTQAGGLSASSNPVVTVAKGWCPMPSPYEVRPRTSPRPDRIIAEGLSLYARTYWLNHSM